VKKALFSLSDEEEDEDGDSDGEREGQRKQVQKKRLQKGKRMRSSVGRDSG